MQSHCSSFLPASPCISLHLPASPCISPSLTFDLAIPAPPSGFPSDLGGGLRFEEFSIGNILPLAAQQYKLNFPSFFNMEGLMKKLTFGGGTANANLDFASRMDGKVRIIYMCVPPHIICAHSVSPHISV